MLGRVVQHVASLAEGREVGVPVVGGVVVAVSGCQHDSRASNGTQHVVLADREADHLP